MPQLVEQYGTMSAGDTRNVAIDFTDNLDSGEVLTGTPTIVEVTTTDLSLSNKAVSTGSLTILGATVATGKAVQFAVTGSTVGRYTIRVTVGTDSTPAQTLVIDYKLTVV